VLDPPIHRLTWIAEAQEAGVGLDQWPDPKAAALHEMYVDKLRAVLATAGERTR
jgi:chromosome partitioning protein